MIGFVKGIPSSHKVRGNGREVKRDLKSLGSGIKRRVYMTVVLGARLTYDAFLGMVVSFAKKISKLFLDANIYIIAYDFSPFFLLEQSCT